MAKRNTRKKHNYKEMTISILLCLLVLGISYMIFVTDILKPSVNEVTTSYISFNNRDNTDDITINNISKMSDELGKSIANTKSKNLLITGEDEKNYEVVIYPVINDIDLKYIKASITINNKTYTTNLSDASINSDGGITIYQDMKKDKNILIKMWIDKDYKKEVPNTSFKIKIKQK